MNFIIKNALLTLTLIATSAIAGCQQTPTPPVANTTTTDPKPTASTTQTPSNFDEALYLFANPDVAELIKQGKYTSGLDHYTKVGQTAKNSDGNAYESFFIGTNGNDTVSSFGKGKHNHLIGVKFEVVPNSKAPLPLRPASIGQGESDVLIGTKEGVNEFVLGSFATSLSPKAQPFYVGKGDADLARIQNFTKTKDSIMLAGAPQDYQFKAIANNLNISTASGDLVAIVEGVDKLTPEKVPAEMKALGIFLVK
jgi:hypothetical protein